MIVGVGGLRRNAGVAVVDGPTLRACEQERAIRLRGAGVAPGGFPHQALAALLDEDGRRASDVRTIAAAEYGLRYPPGAEVLQIDHHLAHAATTFFTSGADEALVLVCDTHGHPEVTLWRADARGLQRLEWTWTGPGFARCYSARSPARLRLAASAVQARPCSSTPHSTGFHEPIVCSPRDAIRVFYGTRLDMLVMGNFILHK